MSLNSIQWNVYYESMKRNLINPIHECRCNGRLLNEWVLIATRKQLVWSTRIGRNMSIWILCLILGSGPGADLPLEVTGSCFRAIGTWSPRSSAYRVRCRRTRSHRPSPSVNPVQRTSVKGSTPSTSKRPRVDVIKNALFESSCQCAGTGRARSDNLPRRNATATCARVMGQDFLLHEDIDFFLFHKLRDLRVSHTLGRSWNWNRVT